MISGVNSSVRFGGEDFHVQTEDRGRKNPIIESMIYQGGAIIGTKKTSYKEFLGSTSFDEQTLHAMLEKQHYSIVQAIRSGRVSARRQERERVKAQPLAIPSASLPHVEFFSNVLEQDSPDGLQEIRLRIVEPPDAKAVPDTPVAIELFGGGTKVRRLKGVTNADGFIDLKLTIPKTQRVSAAIIFRNDKPAAGLQLRVLLVKKIPKK